MENGSNRGGDEQTDGKDLVLSEPSTGGIFEITDARWPEGNGQPEVPQDKPVSGKSVARLTDILAVADGADLAGYDPEATQAMPKISQEAAETSVAIGQPPIEDFAGLGLFTDENYPKTDEQAGKSAFGGFFEGTKADGGSGHPNRPTGSGQEPGGHSRGPKLAVAGVAAAVLIGGGWVVGQLKGSDPETKAQPSSADGTSQVQLNQPSTQPTIDGQNLIAKLSQSSTKSEAPVKPSHSSKPNKPKSASAEPSAIASPSEQSSPEQQPTPETEPTDQAEPTPTPTPTESTPTPQLPELTYSWNDQLSQVVDYDKLHQLEASYPKLAKLMQSDDWQKQLKLDHYSTKTIRDYQAAYAAAYADSEAADIIGAPGYVGHENLSSLSDDADSDNDVLVKNTDAMMAAAAEAASETSINTVNLAYLGDDLQKTKLREVDQGAQARQAEESAVLAIVETKLGDGTPAEVALVWSDYGDNQDGDSLQYVRAYLPIAVNQEAAPGLPKDAAIPVAVAERRLDNTSSDSDDQESDDSQVNLAKTSTPEPTPSTDASEQPPVVPTPGFNDFREDFNDSVLSPVEKTYSKVNYLFGVLGVNLDLPGNSWHRDRHALKNLKEHDY